jgi:hypothetical protein
MIKYDNSLEDKWGLSLLDDNTVRKESSIGTKENWECFLSIMEYALKNIDSMLVPVYNFKVTEEPAPDYPYNYGIYRYYYDMKRLGMLSQQEKELITWTKKVHLYGRGGLNLDEHDLLKEYRVIYPDLADFMDEVIQLNRYRDIHDGNFLLDEEGNYKIIDLEGFIWTPVDRKENNWLRSK